MKRSQKLKSKVRNSYLISTMSISLVLFLLGSVGYMMVAALNVARTLSESLTATIELRSTLNEAQLESIRHKIAAHPLAGEVRFSSKEEKIQNEEFREMFGLEFEDILDENPLLNTFEVTLTSKSEEVGALKEFSDELMRIYGITRVSYPAMLVEQMHSTIGRFHLVLMMFGGALLFISLVLLNNTIRMAIFSRRALINTMKLVGATKWFIIRPFLWSGLWSGFWAGVMASILLGAVLYALQETFATSLTVSQLQNAAYIMGAMVSGGVVISTLFTWMSVNRFVNMKSNKIHLY